MNIIDAETTKEQITKEYESYPSTMSDLQDKPYYQSRLAPIFYEIRPGSKVLDVGCNDGVFGAVLKDRLKCDVTGVDLSDVALELAKKRGLNVLKADAENLPFEDHSFDVVCCMEVLSHLFDPEKALKEMRRVLKKNGILLGSCPHKTLETYAWEDKRMHRRYFDVNELHELLGKHFEKSWIRTLTGGQFALSLAQSFLADEPAEMLFKSGADSTMDWDQALKDRSILRCWFGASQTPGTVYYRMSGFADKMQEMGAQVHYNPYDENSFNSPGDWCQKIAYLKSENRVINAHIVHELEALLKAADMSVFQIMPTRDMVLVLTTARKGVIKKPMWVEIDDWIFDVPSYNLASTPYHPNSEMESVAYDQIKLSDGIIVSTEYLKEKFSQIFPEKRIYVVRNCIDFKKWDAVERPHALHEANPELVRIGYTGCGNHSGDLELIKEPIRALLEEFENLEFVCLEFESLKGIKNPRFKPVDKWVGISAFPQIAASWEMDIGIAPLRDHELNRAKSNLRWLEYSALKVPTIASRVYPFEKSISHKTNGILVGNSKREWYDAMKALIVEKGERARLGANAYAKIKKDYNMDEVAKSYLSILKQIKSEFLKNESKRPSGGMRTPSIRS